jgi:hypothetical protein
MLLDTFMKQFYGPAHPVPGYNLACGGPQIIAGKGDVSIQLIL